MTYARPDPLRHLGSPPWISPLDAGLRVKTFEDAAFFSGASLACLHGVLNQDDVPQSALRDRLALQSAEVCMVVSGRPERAGELRDAIHFLRPGDLPGPAGEICLCWRRAVERPVSVKALRRALPAIDPARVAHWFDVAKGAPVARAVRVLEAVLTEMPRGETAGLILGDAALARALGWSHILPLLAPAMKRSDLCARGDDLRLACHHAVATSAAQAARLAADLARRAARLKAVAPKLRARGAGEAVEMFLTRDAVAPTALAGGMSDRSARRLCDRLVALGAVRELTGRDTFRLYGM